MKSLCLFALLMVQPLFAQSPDTPRDGVFIHISNGSDNAHSLLMALNMANLMADDHDVLVYMDINAVEVVLENAEDVEFSHFPSVQTLLASLKEKDVILMACPGCLQVIDKSEDDLMDGVILADKTLFFSFTKGRILSLDY